MYWTDDPTVYPISHQPLRTFPPQAFLEVIQETFMYIYISRRSSNSSSHSLAHYFTLEAVIRVNYWTEDNIKSYNFIHVQAKQLRSFILECHIANDKFSALINFSLISLPIWIDMKSKTKKTLSSPPSPIKIWNNYGRVKYRWIL